jgi:predicted aspartyl protease
LPVDALLDTGSTEWLAINAQDLESLGWSMYGTRDIQTARGNMAFSTYLGRVLLDRQEFTVPVVAGAAFQEILLHAVG